MKRIRVLALAMSLSPSIGVAGAQDARRDSTWQDHDRAADSAAARRDWKAYVRHVSVIDTATHHHPSATLALARGYAQLGDTTSALALLRDLAASGVSRNLTTDSLLRPLHASAAWRALRIALEANARPRGAPASLFSLPDSGFAAEDLAYDARRHRYFLSGIRGRRVVEALPNGGARDMLVSSATSPLWAVLALGVDTTHDRLWVTTVGNDRIPGLEPGEAPRASILCIDLLTERVVRRYDMPNDGVPREPADLVVTAEGDAIVSDGRTGAVYVIETGADSIRVLVPRGELLAPQQPAVAGDGRTILVPDYARGMAAVDRKTGAVRWLTNPRSVVVNGIDGLTWAGPRTLIAVQNGVTPARIVRLTVDESLESITRSDVLAQGDSIRDPTHGVVVGDHYDFIAYSGGSVLLPNGDVRPGARLLAPRGASIPLR